MRSFLYHRIVLSLFCTLAPLLPAAGQLYWDPDGAISGTGISGNWNTITTNWTTSPDSGVNTVWTQGSDAVFGVTNSYTVTLADSISVGNVTVTGTSGILTISGVFPAASDLTLGAPSTFNIGGSRTNIVSGKMIGSGSSLTKSGNGTLVLSAANKYDGGTTLSAGTIGIGIDSVSSGGVITSGPLGTGTLNLSAAATVNASGGPRVVQNPVTLNSGLTNLGNQTLTFTNGTFQLVAGNRNVVVSNTADLVIGSNIIDDGAVHTLTKHGAARLILAGTNSGFGGPFTINAGGGTVRIANDTALQFGGVVTVNTLGTLDLNGYSGKVVGLAGAGSVTLGSGVLTIANAGTSRNFTGVISGPGSMIVSNSVSQQLEGLNTFLGGILIKAGTLFLRTNVALNDQITKAAGTGTITVEGADPTTINVTAALGGNAATGVVQITNRVVITTGRVVLFPSNGGTVEYDGVISGVGGIQRDNNGSGAVVLTGNNTFSGGVRLESRVLAIGHRNALGTGTFIIGNAITPPSSTIAIPAIANLSGANAITNYVGVNQNFTIPDSTAGANDLELSGPMTLSNPVIVTASGTALVNFSGNIDGPGGLTKSGANALVLSGNNTYAGSTGIGSGTLLVNNTTGSGTSTGLVTVGSSCTLGGSGIVAGPVTVNGGGNVAAGSSVGKLTLLSGLDMSAGANDTWELGTKKDDSNGTAGIDFDQIAISDGGLNLGSSSTLTLAFIGSTNVPTATNTFWRAVHHWTVIKLSGTASNTVGTAFSAINNGNYSVGSFTNSVTGNGSILLTFNPVANPSITSVTRTGNDVNVTFVAANGSNYRVEYATSLSPANWQLLQTVTGTGAPVTITDTNPPDPHRFYRIVLTD